MKISNVYIENYRNFKKSNINFNKETLIIGPNDVGKTNLIRAMRLILDKSLSQLDIEPLEEDFNIFSEEDEFKIQILFDDYDEVKDEAIRGYLGKFFTEDDKLLITYIGYKYKEESYKIYIGEDEEIGEATSRYYLKYLNMVYLDSTRNLTTYLKKSKERLVRRYKENRDDIEVESDNQKLEKIAEERADISNMIDEISYVEKSVNIIKEHLNDISVHNSNNEIKLRNYNENQDLAKNLELVAISNGKNIGIGGDGRNNQIYLTMWLEEINYICENTAQTTIFVIEEPEAHLHPSLQSMTLKKILQMINNQIIITTHSQQVALEFKPNSIIRLFYDKNYEIQVAKNGCSKEIASNILDLAYRNNIINGEMFFADVVLLVEGISEKLLYKELSKQFKLDIEKYNIVILAVDGVGFEVYTEILYSLGIPFIIRTDNDIIKKKNGKYYCSGILRLTKIYNKYYGNIEKVLDDINSKELGKEEMKILRERKRILENRGLYLAKVDLEEDLVEIDEENKIKEIIEKIEKEEFADEEVSEYMKTSKGINMYKILNNGLNLDFIKGSNIEKPLIKCINMHNKKTLKMKKEYCRCLSYQRNKKKL